MRAIRMTFLMMKDRKRSLITELVDRREEVALIRKEPSPELLLRYETSIEQKFDKTLAQLDCQQRMRREQSVPPVKVKLSA